MQSINFNRIFTFALAFVLTAFTIAAAAQDRRTGGVRGRVRVETGGGAAGVTVTAQRGEQDVATTTTDRSGEFTLSNLQPGVYSLVFRRPGLRVGTLNNIEVRAGHMRRLQDRLILPVDEGTLALVRGSVFTPEGRSLRNARVEIARVGANGALQRIDYRITNDMGEFAFRLPPDEATYRVTATFRGAQPATRDVRVEGAAIYRLALRITSSEN